jgi:Domain of unknown function (DUF4349)/Putative zinc-finger
MPNETIHDEIEEWLAADVHDQLSDEERAAFQRHLAVCDSCHALQGEVKQMHQLLENTLATESVDPAFEQRMVRRFRDKIPVPNGGLSTFLAGLIRMRAAQITAVAALLLTLAQVGRMVTNEAEPPGRSLQTMEFASVAVRDEKKVGPQGVVSTGANMPAAEEAEPNPTREVHRDAVAKAAKMAVPVAPAPPQPATAGSAAESYATDAESEAASADSASLPRSDSQRKLVRNARVQLEIVDFDGTVRKITALAKESGGYIVTSSSQKQANGKLQGEVVAKVLPDKLDAFLLTIRGFGELKDQSLGSEDVTKAYFDTDARLKNARVMEQRLLDMLKTKTGKVSDLLQVEKELARVREEIETMQGDLKYWDTQVQFATVTISLAEKDLNEPAAFLLKETANLSLFSSDVEKTFVEVKNALQNAKAQIVQSTLDRDNSGQTTARMTLLLTPEESEAVISRIKSMGRVQNFNVQTERVAQDGSGISASAKVKHDKVQLNLVISRTEEEQSVQQTNLRILTSSVTEKVEQLKTVVVKADGALRSSTFLRNPDGQEIANLTLRVPMKNYAKLVAAFDQLGEVKDLSVQRNDQPGATSNRETAPADISVQIYNSGKIVSDQTGLGATIRRTLGQGVAALMWSARMIGVAIAFLAPWVLALGLLGWLITRFAKRRVR